MGTRIGFVALGVLTAWVAVACGDDAPVEEQHGTAGAAGASAGAPEDGQAGSDANPSGGTSAQAGNGGSTSQAGTEPIGGASGGSDGEGGMGGEAAPSTDVHGVVEGYEWPVADAVVMVDGVITQSDAQGRFTVPDVADHYQLVVAVPSAKVVLVYEDVSTRTPRAQFGLAFQDPSYPYSSTVSGEVKGPNGAPLTEDWISLFVVAPGQRTLAASIVVTPETIDMKPRWAGGPKLDAELWALQDTDAGDILGFARRSLSLQDGKPITDDLQLEEVAVKSRALKLGVAPDWNITNVAVQFGPVAAATGIKTAGDHTVKIPQIDDATVAVSVFVKGDDGSQGNLALEPPADGAWEISVPALPQHLSPPADANAVTKDTVFAWTKPTGFVTSVAFEVEGWGVYLATDKTQSKIPDLSALGISFEGKLTGSWGLYAVGPAETVDDQMRIEHEEYAEPFHTGSWGFLYEKEPLKFTAPP